MSYSCAGNDVYYYGDPQLEAQTDLRSFYRKAQSYPQILKEHVGSVFQDPEFPHSEDSIGKVDTLLDIANPSMASMVQGWRDQGWNGRATWVRVTELCKRVYQGEFSPRFNFGAIGKASGRLDIKQGLTGDCWFLCALSAVSMVKSLATMVIPADNASNNSGVYHIRFWYQGSWVDIVVDDFIPCFVVGETYNIIGSNFFTSSQYAEFWPMLVEKAFAKLNGSYANIASNVSMYALESLTGGFGECVMFDQGIPPHLFEDIIAWLGKDSINCAGTADRKGGIVGNHAYSVTGAKTVQAPSGKPVRLLRLRNPWGNTEWKGDWCDSSPLWQGISEADKKALGLVVKDDGEFWMCFEDFLRHFNDLSSCTYFDHSVINLPNSQLRFFQKYDEWSRQKNTAGGWANPHNNPHYPVELSSDGGGACVLVIGVTVQEKLTTDLSSDGGHCIRVFEASNVTNFDQDFFRTHRERFPVGKDSAPATSMKSYTVGFQLRPGRYVIVPNALTPGFEKKICLRVLSQKKSSIP